MEPIHYLHLQLRLEGKEIVEERLSGRWRLYLARKCHCCSSCWLANGKVVAYYDEALSRDLQETLAAAMGRLNFLTCILCLMF